MIGSTKHEKTLESCFNERGDVDIVTLIQTNLTSGELEYLGRVSISELKIVLFIADPNGKMRKSKIKEGLEDVLDRARCTMSEDAKSVFAVRCNGSPVSGLPVNTVNKLIVMIQNRKQLQKSRSSSKARKRQALANSLLALIDHAERTGNKSAMNEKVKTLLQPENVTTDAEKEEIAIEEMLERRFQEKEELDKRSFGDIVDDASEETDEVPKTELIEEV